MEIKTNQKNEIEGEKEIEDIEKREIEETVERN